MCIEHHFKKKPSTDFQRNSHNFTNFWEIEARIQSNGFQKNQNDRPFSLLYKNRQTLEYIQLIIFKSPVKYEPRSTKANP